MRVNTEPDLYGEAPDRAPSLASLLRPELPAAAMYGLAGQVATELAEASGAENCNREITKHDADRSRVFAVSALVLRGDARSLPLPDASVDLIVTSPPYFGLRSYTDGGQHYDRQIGSERTPSEYLAALLGCTREWVRILKPGGSIFVNLGDKYSTYTGANWGNGRSLDGYRGQRKVPDGGPVNAPEVYGIPYKSLMGLPWRYALGCIGTGTTLGSAEVVKLLLRDVALGVISLATAEQVVDDLAATPAPGLGLVLRAEIIWDKPNGMPESATDRVRRSHEQVFHFVKQVRRYYSAVDEIREPHAEVSIKRAMPHRSPPGRRPASIYNGQPEQSLRLDQMNNPMGRLPGSVWQIPSQPLVIPQHLGVDHFAAFPAALVRPIILGWSPPGICLECGEGRRPITSRSAEPNPQLATLTVSRAAMTGGTSRSTLGRSAADAPRAITGYACACTPYTDHPGTGEPSGPYGRHADAVAAGTCENVGAGWGGKSGLGDRPRVGPWREYHLDRWDAPPTRPAVVVDPFGGTGTSALVADVLGRTGISVDRSADYCRLARWRTTDPGERAKAMQVPKPPPVPDGQGSLFDPSEVAS